MRWAGRSNFTSKLSQICPCRIVLWFCWPNLKRASVPHDRRKRNRRLAYKGVSRWTHSRNEGSSRVRGVFVGIVSSGRRPVAGDAAESVEQFRKFHPGNESARLVGDNSAQHLLFPVSQTRP